MILRLMLMLGALIACDCTVTQKISGQSSSVPQASEKDGDSDLLQEALGLISESLSDSPVLVSENLIFLNALSEDLQVDLGQVHQEIRARFPETLITLEQLESKKLTILTGTFVPTWFHNIMSRANPSNAAKIETMIRKLLAAAPAVPSLLRDERAVRFMAKVWWIHCIAPSRRFPSEVSSFCVKSKRVINGIEVDGYRLTSSMAKQFVESLAYREYETLATQAGIESSADSTIRDFDTLFPLTS
jgi:hypothetical protein